MHRLPARLVRDLMHETYAAVHDPLFALLVLWRAYGEVRRAGC
jgi:hypothetical protein